MTQTANANFVNSASDLPALDWRKENQVRRQVEAHAAMVHATQESMSRLWAPFDASSWSGDGQPRVDWLNGRPSIEHSWRESLLHGALRVGNPEIVQFLLGKGCDPEAFNSNNEAALDKLFTPDWFRLEPERAHRTFRCLDLVFSALPEARQRELAPRLVEKALDRGLIAAAARLLEIAPSFDLPPAGRLWAERVFTGTNELGREAFEQVQDQEIRFFRALFAHFGAKSIDMANAEGETPLLVCAYFCHGRSARVLLELGADSLARDRRGRDLRQLVSETSNRQSSAYHTQYGNGARNIEELNSVLGFLAAEEAKAISSFLADAPVSIDSSAAVSKRPASRL